MIRVGEKSQAEIAELFNADRSTISRTVKELREKELLKAAREGGSSFDGAIRNSESAADPHDQVD